MIRYVEGDTWSYYEQGYSLAHGCNCIGAMGAGIALQVRLRFPEMYQVYRRSCDAKQFVIGDIYPYWAQLQPARVIFNLMTQWDTKGASYDGVWIALFQMREWAKSNHISKIVMPQIGAGLGGLNWNVVKAMIESIFADSDIDLIVVEKYVPKEHAESH